VNSRGNCYNSLGDWAQARNDYQASSDIFQAARGFKDRNGGSLARLDGSVTAAGNAALMLVQLGDEPSAMNEVTTSLAACCSSRTACGVQLC
jgi:hypothetical protein